MTAAKKELNRNHKFYDFLNFIENRLNSLGIREQALLKKNNIHPDTIRNIRAKEHQPGIDKIYLLSKALDVPFNTLCNLAIGVSIVNEGATPSKNENLVPLLGVVQAGSWGTAFENPFDCHEYYALPPMNLPKIAKPFALQVKGESMNLVYPHGTTIFVVSYKELGIKIRNGDRVVCLRRSIDSDEYEATAKEYRLGPDGQHVLWPRSDHADHQNPIVLNQHEKYSEWGDDLSSSENVIIAGKIVASFRLETK